VRRTATGTDRLGDCVATHTASEIAHGLTDSAVITVASVPADHVYVRHLTQPGDRVVRLPDPPPVGVEAEPGQWWPPAILDARWVHQHADEFDLAHVHFGFDALDAAALSAFVDALDRHGKPLIYTVHDLRNPHHAVPQAHRAHLDVLIARAAALITLTSGAADVVASTWGRRPLVIPHPHVVGFDRMRRPRPRRRGQYVVGLHAKSVRASMAPLPVLIALMPLVDEIPDLRLVVDVHRDVADADGARHDRDLMRALREAAEAGTVELCVHDCYTDDELWDYLQRLDLSVLPYRFGTHSGWLEACHDLGTTVLAPTCGFFAEQRRCLTYPMDETSFDAAALQDAVRAGYERRPHWRADPSEREAERAAGAAAHRAIYESVLR